MTFIFPDFVLLTIQSNPLLYLCVNALSSDFLALVNSESLQSILEN